MSRLECPCDPTPHYLGSTQVGQVREVTWVGQVRVSLSESPNYRVEHKRVNDLHVNLEI